MGLSDIWTPLDRAVLTYVDDIVLQPGRVQDEIFATLMSVLSEVAAIELTYGAAMYQLHGTMCRALRLEYDHADEWIVETPFPAAAEPKT